MADKYKEALKEIKLLIRNQGKSSLVLIEKIDKIFVKYGINLKDLG